MNYEVVELKQKKVVGIMARTSNQDEKMSQIIGELWQQFYGQGIYQAIEERVNDCSIGLYSNYSDGARDAYDVTVCCEVAKDAKRPEGTVVKTIEAGKYAKFVVKGDVQKAVAEFWGKLWGMDLDRRFGSDFEEYQPGGDMQNSEIHMYISIN